MWDEKGQLIKHGGLGGQVQWKIGRDHQERRENMADEKINQSFNEKTEQIIWGKDFDPKHVSFNQQGKVIRRTQGASYGALIIAKIKGRIILEIITVSDNKNSVKIRPNHRQFPEYWYSFSIAIDSQQKTSTVA